MGSALSPNMTISIAGTTASSDQAPVKVLILGGSYGGLAAAMNLADLCAGKPSRFGLQNPQPGSKVPLDITIIDERDGYCKALCSCTVSRLAADI